jgi:hypothetical protein
MPHRVFLECVRRLFKATPSELFGDTATPIRNGSRRVVSRPMSDDELAQAIRELRAQHFSRQKGGPAKDRRARPGRR